MTPGPVGSGARSAAPAPPPGRSPLSSCFPPGARLPPERPWAGAASNRPPPGPGPTAAPSVAAAGLGALRVQSPRKVPPRGSGGDGTVSRGGRAGVRESPRGVWGHQLLQWGWRSSLLKSSTNLRELNERQERGGEELKKKTCREWDRGQPKGDQGVRRIKEYLRSLFIKHQTTVLFFLQKVFLSTYISTLVLTFMWEFYP